MNDTKLIEQLAILGDELLDGQKSNLGTILMSASLRIEGQNNAIKDLTIRLAGTKKEIENLKEKLKQAQKRAPQRCETCKHRFSDVYCDLEKKYSDGEGYLPQHGDFDYCGNWQRKGKAT